MMLFVASSVQMYDPAGADGQFIPLAKHTLCPETSRLEPDALVKAKVVAVACDAVKTFEASVVKVPNDANKFVEVTSVAVAKVSVVPCRFVVPVAVRLDVRIPPNAYI